MQEFVAWNMENAETDPSKSEEEMKNIAKSIFAMFDDDGSGEITVGEFRTALENMNSGLTLDEICAIVKDFDESGDGTISLEEFEEVIEKAINGE
jgi:Ca2+-binding EF-hand superfamily protein